MRSSVFSIADSRGKPDVDPNHTSSTAGKPLSIEHVMKTYQSRSGSAVEALRQFNLEIAAGEFVVVVGPSGCGKSTLLNMLAGFSQPTQGSLRVAGQPIAGPDIDRGMVFQSYALFPWLSVIGNVEFGLERKGVPRAKRRLLAMEYLTMVGLQDFADKHVTELSGGMKQRTAIARAFATEPSIIFMDEPFGALDALTRRFLQKELLRIWGEHKKTIVFITHSVPEAIFLADRIVVMTARPGTIKCEIQVDLPHPREITSDAFRELERRIYSELDEELNKTMSQEGGSAAD
jgi:ABC-type nitrate/sulfonate/bicarbonate transport system ATPase subunit